MALQLHPTNPLYRRFEAAFKSPKSYVNPFQEVSLTATFRAPSGKMHRVDGFWDGGYTWRVRFMPDEIGRWTYTTVSSDAANAGLHAQQGSFECTPALNETPFDRHGPLRLSDNRCYLAHADGTPFFWMSDTAWNGALHSTTEEWTYYLQTRAGQKFSAVQWVTTQWIGSPYGDRLGQMPYTGQEGIAINAAFFQQLDEKVDAVNRAGLLCVPVLLWAAQWGSAEIPMTTNPGIILSNDQAVMLARYMVARWGADHVVWILNGDGLYTGEVARKWVEIGRGVFGGHPHAPTLLHPGGQTWPLDDFINEEWLDMVGYQSGHSTEEKDLSWLVQGPPAADWKRQPERPFINLEPAYEDHHNGAGDIFQRLDAHTVRRALYSSLLVSPTAGVSYGGHGIWGWDDGTREPTCHAGTGIPKPWREALFLEAAMQIVHLREVFNRAEWWRLCPAPKMVLVQPGEEKPSRTILASCSHEGNTAVIYAPGSSQVVLRLDLLHPDLVGTWVNPRNGSRITAQWSGDRQRASFETPEAGDWILILRMNAEK
jgi:hypothetical protein